MENKELALKVLGSSSGDSVFQLSKELVESWISSKTLISLSDKKYPSFTHYLVSQRKKYLLKEFEGNFILCPVSLATKELAQLNKLSELKKVVKIVSLEEASKSIEIEKTHERQEWHYSCVEYLTDETRPLHYRNQDENKDFSLLAWTTTKHLEEFVSPTYYIYQSDSKEKSLELLKELKEKDEAKASFFSFKSHFDSPEELFEVPSLAGERSKEEAISLTEKKESPQEIAESLFELLPTPIDSYKELLANLPREKMRARYFNPNFPISSVLELNNSHYFWALVSPQYRDVDSFAVQLKSFYSTLSAYSIEELILSGEPPQRLWTQLQKETSLSSYSSQSNSFKKILDAKLEELQEKNNNLSTQLNGLKESLLKQGRFSETDPLYMESMKEQKKILEDIENTFKVLHNFTDRLQQYSARHPEFSPNFYLSIFGSKAILTKYDSLVCNALLDLNDQLNEVVFYQQEVERLLFERISALHRARKAEMKLDFLEQDNSLSKLVFAQQKSTNRKSRADELRRLEIQGALELSKHTIQKEIEAEKFKLSNYLDRLQQLDYYPDFEEQSKQLRNKKAIHKQKIEEYRSEIYGLKLKVESVERQYTSFITSIREQILEFQKEVSGTYSGFLSLLHSSVNQVWDDWANQGVGYLERIISRKKTLIKEFAEIMVLELRKMYSTQDNLLAESRARKKEWERVYKEMVDEFKTLGYFLRTPKPSEQKHKYLPKMDKSVFELSPEIKKLIYYRPSLKYTKPKVNELIGLSPKLLNDEEFLVIDQVWTKLTPAQEQKLKEKIFRESQEKDKARLEELIKKAKDDLNKRLKSKDYTFKTLTLEKDFPQEADEEERYRKLKEYEKASFHDWKEMHFTTSELRYKFNDMMTHFSKKLFTLKEVESWGDQLNISDKGKLEDPSKVDKLSEFDYFVKTSEKISLIDSAPFSAFKAEETDLYDLEDEDYLSILEALDDDHSREKEKKGLLPKMEDWSQLNLKRYREEKKKVDVVGIKEGLQSLEKEIKTLQQASGNYREACERERDRREFLFSEMKTELDDLRKYLVKEETELNRIFAEASDMIDLDFEELDRRLDERRKLIAELKLKNLEVATNNG
ncbi:hypothetical protein [Mycoplasma wenyonii]|nr:hypothetical protein [Mycoplasma wenyonii]